MSQYRSRPDDDQDDLTDDLAEDARLHRMSPAARAVEALTVRVEDLEQMVRNLVKPTAKNTVAQGEAVLAKATQTFHDADALLAYADTLTDDPTVMGVISGHLAGGDFKSAHTALFEVQQRGVVAKAAENLEQVVGAADDDLTTFNNIVATSELTARFGVFERAIAAMETRLAQLESRPQAAAPVPIPAGRTVAKAGSKRRLTPEQDAQALMDDLERYVDDASTVGALSSMIQNGDLEKVRPLVERARQAHETEKIRSERRGFRR